MRMKLIWGFVASAVISAVSCGALATYALVGNAGHVLGFNLKTAEIIAPILASLGISVIGARELNGRPTSKRR